MLKTPLIYVIMHFETKSEKTMKGETNDIFSGDNFGTYTGTGGVSAHKQLGTSGPAAVLLRNRRRAGSALRGTAASGNAGIRVHNILEGHSGASGRALQSV